jgi:SAM-dependent methyltransferase
LRCAQGHAYPIEDGVPVLLPAPLADNQARTADAFGYEWLRHRVNLAREEREIFLAETQCDPAEFAGRLILDAGCGMGRFTRVAAGLGAEVVGVDLSPAVRAANATFRDYPLLHVVRGDLLQPPFKTRSFDLAYSLGVLHHTPDTRAALASVTELTKNQGTVTFWLYGRAGRFADFQSNPLEPMRAAFFAKRPWLLRPYWLGLKAREVVSDGLRIFTTRMPVSILYQLCLLLVPLGAVPLLKYFTFSVHPDWRVRRQENFDWLSPPFQFKHAKEEARQWMKELGLREEKMLGHGLTPKIGFKATRE